MFDCQFRCQFAGETVLTMINVVESGADRRGHIEYIQSFLFWERILEQTAESRDSYVYGRITDKNMGKWMERQRDYLVPLIELKMNVFVELIHSDGNNLDTTDLQDAVICYC